VKCRIAILFSIILLMPLISPQLETSFAATAASDPCEGNFSFPEWNETVVRQAKVPVNQGFWTEWDEGEPPRRNQGGNGGENNQDSDDGEESDLPNSFEEYDGPEEEWMTYWHDDYLKPIVIDTRWSMLVGNDAVGALKVNLDHTKRTTICVTIESTGETGDSSNPKADIYLLTTNQWDRYSSSYDARHGAWWGEWSDSVDTSDVSPEWRSFDLTGWRSYRDSHQYENTDQVSFSISLDGPEEYSGLFGGDSIEYFHIVVDNTNNSHNNDAIPESTIAATVSIVSEDRGTILPAWSVSLTCMLFMFGTLAIPMIMNKRYMSAGLDVTISDNQVSTSGLVPSLEQKSDSEYRDESGPS
jgi:hypothetical protein